MSFTFRSVGTVATGNGALNPGAPAGKAVGDLLLLSLVGRDLNQTAPAPTGWTLVSPTTPVGWQYLYARIADGTATDTPTGLLYTGTTRSQAQIAAFSGGLYTDLSTIAANSVDQYLPGTQVSILYSGGLTIAPANCLVIAIGTKNKTATSNGTTINALSGFTAIDSHVINGTDISQWWGYQIQSTPTNIAASLSQTLTGTTETLQYTSMLVALQSSPSLPAATGAYAYSGQGVILDTTATNDKYILCAAGNYNYSISHASSELELTAATTSYGYTGVAVQFPTYAFNLDVGAGIYAYVGKPVTLFFTPAPDPLSADSGAYTYTGKNAQLNASPLPPYIQAITGSYSISGNSVTFTLLAPGAFPSVIGLPLQMAQQALQDAGVLVPAQIGYFGAWPITIDWVQSGVMAGTLMGPGIVIGQHPLAGSAIHVNAPVVLTVTEVPLSVATPPSQANF